MNMKDSVKNVLQAVLYSKPLYASMRRRALSYGSTCVSGAKQILETISPRPACPLVSASPPPDISTDISVIVPVYNVQSYVGACLESILAQDVPATMEVIVVVDGSTDGSEAIARDAAARDGRLRVIVQSNLGLSAARNTGIAAARGRWIAFVDSDDMLAAGHLAALVERMRVGDCDIVGSRWTKMHEDGSIGELGERKRTYMAPWGRLYHRRVWERLRFPVGCWYEDLVTPCCIQPLFHEVLIDDAGYLYRSRPGSIVKESVFNPRALDAYWAFDEMLSWRRELGITYGAADWARFLYIMGPLTMGRTMFLDDASRRALFTALCDTAESLKELSGVHVEDSGYWCDLELAIRSRHYELWCLASAALARETHGVRMTAAWKIYRQARAESNRAFRAVK